MPSPFPGMDPYLEAPDVWPDFHDALAAAIRTDLNRTLPAPYYARLESRPEIGIAENGERSRRIVPDVAVLRQRGSGRETAAGAALADLPRKVISKSIEIEVLNEPLQHHFVEIRDPTRAHQLVTLIEIASPSNKQAGLDREGYLKKQQEIVRSDASLVELDLLRGGKRLQEDPNLLKAIASLSPRPHYVMVVNRAWKRVEGGTACEVFAVTVREMLPCIPIPLRADEEEVPLDLQYVVNLAYDGGPYRRGAVDYAQTPSPPLEGDDDTWRAEQLQALTEATKGGQGASR